MAHVYLRTSFLLETYAELTASVHSPQPVLTKALVLDFWDACMAMLDVQQDPPLIAAARALLNSPDDMALSASQQTVLSLCIDAGHLPLLMTVAQVMGLDVLFVGCCLCC